LLLFFVVSVQKAQITDELKWNLLQKKLQETRAVQAFAAFRDNGIEPILIKGLAAAQFYPEPGSRASSDIDLAVPNKDFDAALAVATSLSAKRIGIDIHREFRHLDTLAWEDLFENSRLLQLKEGTVRVLRPEDNLRVLCVHWLNDGGAYKDRLWDIYYAVKNRPADFDWDRCLNSVSKVRRRWIVCTLGLTRRYLELSLDDTPVNDEAYDLPKWLIRELEREWASEIRLMPLYIYLKNMAALFAQIKKRLRPNAIQVTIEMEGSFDARTRLFYQVGNIFKRIMPSYQRISRTIISPK
jgi:hypothetical protein